MESTPQENAPLIITNNHCVYLRISHGEEYLSQQYEGAGCQLVQVTLVGHDQRLSKMTPTQ